jgi:hypothetical protein
MANIKSKGQEIKYGPELQCQDYLLPNNILTLPEQRTIFSYRTRMNKLKYNFKGKNCEEKCKCGQELTNLHLYECRILNNSLRTVTYSKLFDGRLCEMKYIIGILKENMKIHEEYTQDQDSSPLSH